MISYDMHDIDMHDIDMPRYLFACIKRLYVILDTEVWRCGILYLNKLYSVEECWTLHTEPLFPGVRSPGLLCDI